MKRHSGFKRKLWFTAALLLAFLTLLPLCFSFPSSAASGTSAAESETSSEAVAGSAAVSGTSSEAVAGSAAESGTSSEAVAGSAAAAGKLSAAAEIARPSGSGALHVDGTHLADEDGNVVTLRGVSTHGLTWYPKVINQGLFTEVSDEWGANLLRLPVYSEAYVKGSADEYMELLEKGIQYAVDADLYVIVDWHILEDSDPNTYMPQAIAFFRTVAEKYGDLPNVIYEICNEPNGDTDWEDIRNYAACVIPVIRNFAPDAVIVVGTPNYDRELAPAVQDPITDYDNIMYTFHFYAASHGQELMQELNNAVNAGLPVFVTECGLCEDSGDGTVDYEQASVWFEILAADEIPYTIWSLSNKDESASMIREGVHDFSYLKDSDLTPVGKYVKALMGGQEPSAIIPAVDHDKIGAFLKACRSNWALTWAGIAAAAMVITLLFMMISGLRRRNRRPTYTDYLKSRAGSGKAGTSEDSAPLFKRLRDRKERRRILSNLFLIISTICSLIYLTWRVVFSIPVYYGAAAIAGNLILLIAEILGFVESQIHYHAMLQLRSFPLPAVSDEEFPDVDIFIATYNEPAELLRKTIIGCRHIKYPDPAKVHIYLLDDNRRPEIRALASELGILYFDRPDNKGAKAGNLNHALERTTSPYVVTLDADMIPMEDFLLQTIPYYIDAEKRGIPLGFIQTPQCFYTYDVFQYNLYAENNIPNEQDFFYRSIEPAKTATNSVIYGGSNTILSRKALEAIGGFYTESITEDFATGMLIESHGFVSLGLPDPLASGMAPSSFEEHLQQRTRWGRGVIVTAKKLQFMKNKDLTLEQKLSYLSSVAYWFNPLLNMIYLVSPLLYSLFGICVFRCTFTELLIFWLPMFIAQTICLRTISAGRVSTTWSSLQEMSVMPFLFIPILKETFGISLTTFKVTDKSRKSSGKTGNRRLLIPFAVFAAVCVIGMIRVIYLTAHTRAWGLLILLFWMGRNLYYLIMGMFLADGRESDEENIRVRAAENVTVRIADHEYSGITTQLTEHSVQIFLDDPEALHIGDRVRLKIDFHSVSTEIKGAVTAVRRGRSGRNPLSCEIEILDYRGKQDEYTYALYDRVPTMPQSLGRDLRINRYLLRNIARRIGSLK